MSSATLPPEAAAYLAQLERELADLPAEERADLLEEVEASLLEGEQELGDPARFAAELRASAGLPAAAPSAPGPSAWRRFKRHPAMRLAATVAGELVPLWWVARGIVAVELLAVLARRDTGGMLIYPDSRAGLLVLAVAVAVSAGIGLAGRRRPLPFRGLRVATDVLLALVLLAILPIGVSRVRDRLDRTTVVPQVEVQQGLALNGVPIQNIYPYDARGRLLHHVRLYDQNGRPIDIGGAADPLRQPVRTRNGTPVFNAFPIRFVEPRTHRVARPNATPRGLKPKPLSAGR